MRTKDLSKDIEFAVDNCIDVLNFSVDIVEVKSDKLASIMSSKIDTFSSAKKLILSWQNSPNSPSDDKLVKYIKRLVSAGDSSIEVLRQALRKKIDPDDVDPEKHGAAAKAKPLIMDAIFEINRGVTELQLQLDAGKIDLAQREFTRGYPEKFANQEFFPEKNYHKEWYDEATDSVMICPKGTKGEVITLDNLNIMLPAVPKNKKDILFSNLPKEEQYWRRQPMPKGCIPENEDQYTEYILEEFRRRREGIFFMNNGEPIYLTGVNYMGLQWDLMLDTGTTKDFRYAQTLLYYFAMATVVDPRSVGMLFIKGRRTGFSEIILDHFVHYSTSIKNGLLGMTSKVGDDAQEMFLKYAYEVQNLPFFFVPVVKGKIDDRNKMEFGKVSDSTKAAKKRKDTSTDDYLNTKTDWMNSTTLAYDSKKLRFYLCDEAGKREKPQNIIDHWSNVKPCLVTGGRVVGTCFMGSTLNSFDKGGAEYQTLYYGSDVKKRNANGRTSTGLYSYFLPAHKNMEDYTDKYGVCHETLLDGDAFYNAQGIKMTQGSLQYLENEFKSAKAMGGKTYNNSRRLDPITIDDAFRDELQQQLFDIEKINSQLTFNRENNIENTLVRGNFYWKDGIKDTQVEWKPEPKGRFLVSWIPPVELRNRWVTKSTFGHLTKCPAEDYGAAGVDSYDQTAVIDAKLISTDNGTEYNIGSKGAMHIVTCASMENIPSNQFVLEYIARPKEADIFFEDALMACVFYSLPVLAENNKKMLLKHFRTRGYRGYSITRFDKELNRLSADEKELGGVPSSGGASSDTTIRHWTGIEKYINDFVGIYEPEEGEAKVRTVGEIGSMPFNRTLSDWLKFDPAKRTSHDASISSGFALMAIRRHMYKPKTEKKPIKLQFNTYSN